MKRSLILAFFILNDVLKVTAQYAPQAGVPGSTAVHKTSAQVLRWATGCTIQRGLQQLGNSALGYATSGDSSLAIGAADGSVVSLGDSGIAVLTFASPIVNGPGNDFAIFENGFGNQANIEEAFLELAFLEVSSDGINFFRFPPKSTTQDTDQISSIIGMNFMNARQVHNLAGKYISSYGTPFDLQELSGVSGLNINAITHVRIVDVIGTIDESHASRDTDGRKINDPFPTAFPTGGFDLDAVAVLNGGITIVSTIGHKKPLTISPNPASDFIIIRSEITGKANLKISDAMGRTVLMSQVSGPNATLNISGLATGIYYITVNDENGNQWVGKVYRR